MRYKELIEDAAGVGVVANNKKMAKDPRYSTSMTVDVKPGETQRQAKKFGNKLDKKGHPPTLSKKVKGSKTNVLFNLGLAESVAIKFERGNDYDILHIKEKGKNRVEVRGKSGYETGNYDPKDKLHKVLDGLKKAANISELMNGETVVINPKHPDGPQALDKLKNLEEALGEIAPNTEIYVDMDGVLADFFGEWSKSQGVDNWKDIEDPAKAIGDIKSIEDFWLNLPILPKAKELLGLIKQVKGKYKICTSPLADDPRSEPHKREWVKKNLSFFPPEEVIVTHNKPQFAKQKDGTPNILIDDYGVNIDAWEKAGGIGFKYKDYKFNRTAKAIKSKIEDPVQERSLSKGEEKKKEKYVKGMKKAKGDFKDRYGDDAEAVMYATATKMAKEALQNGRYTPDQILEILENFADGMKKVNEVLDNPAPYTWRRNEFGFPTAEAKELGLHIKFDGRNQPQWEVSFYREQKNGSIVMNRPTGQGKEFQVFATVSAAIKDFMKMHPDAEGLTLDAAKDGGVDGQGRVSLYRRMMNNYAKKLGWEFEEWDEGQMVAMGIYKPRTNENFADGKKKGKSRPGRVKKSGASCSSSVTELRKKAKNASGERAKMYHWCANMKSGRKKK